MRYIQRVYNHFRAYHFTIISNILKYNKYGYIFASLHFAKVLIARRATTFAKVLVARRTTTFGKVDYSDYQLFFVLCYVRVFCKRPLANRPCGSHLPIPLAPNQNYSYLCPLILTNTKNENII